MTEPMFLGLDASTQALKASLLTYTLDVRKELAVNFDQDLPHYKTKGGVHHGPDGQVHSPVEIIVEAFDLLFLRMKEAGWPLSSVGGIAAAGQQHASVYWNHEASSILSSVSPDRPLLGQMKGAFSRQVIPNWQDSSTTAECREIESAVGGAEELARLTGSKAHERFTGPQIMRWRRAHPDQFANTHRISLVSSYITTLLCLDGEIKGIDESDVCGMNLWTMNTKQRGWNGDVLRAIAGDEADKLAGMLGEVERDGGKPAGKIGKWFVDRWGFNPDCLVFPGTGDNPATFLSLTLRPSEGLISLGTSDVVLVSTKNYAPDKEYHAFFHPAQIPPDQGGRGFSYFNMLVYKNGSLAREWVRDQYFDKSWDKFNTAVEARRPKTAEDTPEQAAFYWLLPDIIPTNAYGTHRYLSSPSSSSSSAQKVDEFSDPTANALAILEAQFLSYASRTGSILESATTRSYSSLPRLSRVYATGGASANSTILSLASDILGAEVCKNVEYEPETGWVGAHWNACSVGMAYKARWGYERATVKGKELVEFDQVISECRDARRMARKEQQGKDLRVDADVEEGVRIVARPGQASEAYAKCMDWWAELETRAVKEGAVKVNGNANGNGHH